MLRGNAFYIEQTNLAQLYPRDSNRCCSEFFIVRLLANHYWFTSQQLAKCGRQAADLRSRILPRQTCNS